MDGYLIIVFFHVLFAIVWIGGGVMVQILMARAQKAGPEDLARLNDWVEWTSQRVFMPSSFLVLGFGIWAVLASDVWGFTDSWVLAGLIGYAISAINGMANLGPTAKKMKERIASNGPNDPVVAQLARRMSIAGRVELFVMVLVVFNMVVKPGAN